MLFRNLLKYNPSKRIVIFLILISILIILFISALPFTREIFLFQKNRVIFTFSSDYLHNYTSKPGGLLEYAGNFITQGYYSFAIGILILYLFINLSWVVLFKINTLLSADGAPPIYLTIIPVCFLLICFTSFYYFIHYALGYLTAVAFFLLTIISGKKSYLFFLAFFPLLFYVIGSFSFIYAGLCFIWIIVTKEGLSAYLLPVLEIIYVFLTFAVIKNLLFLQPAHTLLVHPLLLSSDKEIPFFLIILSGFTVFLPWFLKWPFLLRVNTIFSGTIPVSLFLSLTLASILLLHGRGNSGLAEITRIEQSVYEQDWDSVIKLCKNSQSTNLTGYYYNLALANKDQLCEKLFYSGHSFNAESLTLPRSGEYYDRAVYYYYTIGLINEAHHLAYESMVKNGYCPENIKMLIKTNLLNKKYTIAKRYINILSKTIHFKGLAAHYKDLLNNPVLISSDPELGKKINMLPKNDFFIRDFDDQNIELFLIANPFNKTAFEYKMARLLFNKDIETMIYEVKYMKGIGYMHIPRHIEEAILTYEISNKEVPDLGDLKVSSETVERFAQYNNTLNRYKNVEKSLLKSEMKSKWGNTFWYYFQFK